MGPTPKISEAIIDVLKRQEQPIEINEIAFKTRTSRSAINDVLARMTKAKIVIANDNKYTLNSQNDYDFSTMFE